MSDEVERQLALLKPGDHICPIYSSIVEQMAVAVPFVRDGLSRGDRCIYVSDGAVKGFVEALDAAGIDVARECDRGRLLLLTKSDSYLLGGTFAPEAMIGFLCQAEAQALADGLSGLRFAGEMTWALGPEPGYARLIEYEALLNRFVAGGRSVILCQYDRSRFDPSCIHDVLLTHPLVVLGTLVCPNPYYEPPELVLSPDPEASAEFKAKRVDWWIAQLKRARDDSQERENMFMNLQALSRQLIGVQESERRHLARELHDEIGQALTGVRLLVQSREELPTGEVKARFEQVRGIVDELLERIRRLSFDLRPSALDQLGLLPALLALFERFTSQTGILVHFKHEGIEGRFAPEVETTAYRIAQESLTNVARHAGVRDATVRVWATADTLNVQIEDRGCGFDPEVALAAPTSIGLAGMRERVTLLGGHLSIESGRGSGTQLTAHLPLIGINVE